MFKNIRDSYSQVGCIFLICQFALFYALKKGMFSALTDPDFSYYPDDIFTQVAGLGLSVLFPLYLFIPVPPTLRQELISFYFSSLGTFLSLTAWGLFLGGTGICCFLALTLLLPLRSDLLALIETAILAVQLITVGTCVVLLVANYSYRVVRCYVQEY